ncbi:hypothetical protein [Celeribacter marinus]|uniref:hypothetical protein n=1 Tax=Celeribacter marinus TaxID=1397108 RepID=UPI0031799094
MQPLIYKAPIVELQINPSKVGVALGDHAELELGAEQRVVVYLLKESRLPFGLGRQSRIRAGLLSPQAADIISPALARDAVLRVRVVEVEPAFVRSTARGSICLSVWGNPNDLE